MKNKNLKKHKKTNKNSFILYKYIIIFLIVIILSLSGFIAGYLFNQKESQKKINHYQNTLLTLQQQIDKLSKEIKKYKTSNTEAIDFMQNKNNIPQLSFDIKPLPHPIKKIKKPKLVIIIDDVAFKYEVKMIKSIPYKITPSFFPANNNHPNTPIYAESFKNYMVHVPMEAFNFAHPEPKTLLASDNYETIKKRIDLIKKEFPKVKFINNHTGSKFTSTLKSMNYLFIALKKDNLGFVDSKTTPLSKSLIVDKIHHIPLFSRDIFLDNEENPNYIRNQLKKAINIAKRKGYAIAIGHPHKITLETIKNSKDLLNQVDVITIDELAKYEKN